MKSMIMTGISKIFQSTPEKKLPDRFLDCLDTMNMNATIAEDEDEATAEEKKENKKKFSEFKKKVQHLDKERKKAAFKQQMHLKKELEADLKIAKATIDGKKLKAFVNQIDSL